MSSRNQTSPGILLYKEDCLKGMSKRLKAGSVDIVVTSPPYNIGVKYQSYEDTLPRAEYLAWLDKWAEAVKRVLKDDGSLFLNIGSRPTEPEIPFEVLKVMKNHFILQNVIHWVKSIYIESDSYGQKTDINVGHYKPINSERFLNDTHEYVFHLTGSGKVKLDRLAIGVPYKDKSNIERWNNGGEKRRCRGNCWFIPYKTIQHREKDRPHPASFPPELAESCIRLHGLKKNMLVMDPFAGIGNTALAAKKLKTGFIGFELDASYLKVARKAIADLKYPVNT